MCEWKPDFENLKEQTESNSKQIAELAKSDAVQSAQIKDLAAATSEHGACLIRLVNRLVAAIIGILVITVLAVIFGALGKDGFNAVTRALPPAAEVSK